MKLFSKVDIYICIQNLSAGDTLLAWGFYNYYPARYFISHTTHDYPPGYFRDAIVHPPDTFVGGYLILRHRLAPALSLKLQIQLPLR